MTPFRLSQLLGVLSLLQVVKCDFVRTSKSCYTVGEDIIVTFENDNPLVDDWVGFYAPNTPRNRLGNVPDSRWLWTCGSQSCSGRRPSGTLRFTATISAGNYRAYLARNGNSAPFQGLERSDRFEVRTSCGPGAPPPPGPAPPPPAPPGQQSITTDKRTYSAGETVVVRFRVSNPRNDDWIGIYPSTANQNNLRDGELWLRTCNRQGAACDGARADGTVRFGAGNPVEDWDGTWPLGPGRWRAYLLREGQEPWQVVTRSLVFEVEAGGGGGGGGGGGRNPARVEAAIRSARSDIERIIQRDRPLAAKFLRLIFHDCVGGCDGCVDLQNEDNFGLLEPIAALRPVVQDHEPELSRADIWAMAAIVGCDVSQGRQSINFPFNTFGRVNCEDANNQCRDQNGRSVPCRDTRGPHRELPPADITTRDLFRFMRDEFGYSTRQTVAVMGAHTIGTLSRENSGIDGPNGWLLNNDILDNEYYIELVGGNSLNDPLETLINGAPNWRRDVEDNRDLPEFRNRHIWTGFPRGQKIVMLNSDIALVRELDNGNMAPNGQVSCNFINANRCPHARQSFQFAAEYTFDNRLWLRDFRQVMDIMIFNGYRIPNRNTCLRQPVCELVPR